MKNLHCFNTATWLWANYRQSRKGRGVKLQIVEGHVYTDDDTFYGFEIRGRFPTTEDAEKTLLEAGYVKNSDGFWV